MDLKTAFYKQKDELNQLKRDYAKLEKKLIKAIKENAADERVQELLKKNYRYVEIRLVNTTCGEVDTFRSTEDLLMAEYNESYEIELISMKEILVYEESEKINKIRKNRSSIWYGRHTCICAGTAGTGYRGRKLHCKRN